MEPAADTATLVEQAKSGSRQAFNELVRQHHVVVRSFVNRMLRDSAAADDLAQEVFLTAFRQLSEYRGEAPFGSWLLGIARNRSLAHLRGEIRRRRREERAFDLALTRWQFERLEKTEDAVTDHQRRLVALRRCIEALPQSSRLVVDRFYFDDASTETIAAELNKNSGAVRMMLLRVRRALGKCVASKLSDVEYQP